MDGALRGRQLDAFPRGVLASLPLCLTGRGFWRTETYPIGCKLHILEQFRYL